jgi:hypothetical protein
MCKNHRHTGTNRGTFLSPQPEKESQTNKSNKQKELTLAYIEELTDALRTKDKKDNIIKIDEINKRYSQKGLNIKNLNLSDLSKILSAKNEESTQEQVEITKEETENKIKETTEEMAPSKENNQSSTKRWNIKRFFTS